MENKKPEKGKKVYIVGTVTPIQLEELKKENPTVEITPVDFLEEIPLSERSTASIQQVFEYRRSPQMIPMYEFTYVNKHNKPSHRRPYKYHR